MTEGCERVGTRTVKGNPTSKTHHDAYEGESTSGFLRGVSTVDAWLCVPGCPVADLDDQSGARPSTGPYPSSTSVESIYRPGQGAYQAQGPLYDDKGGASRYFKQVQKGGSLDHFQADLIGYLTTMIGTPELPGVYWKRIYDDRLAEYPASHLPGLIVHGTPTDEQAAELMRILMPGAHLLLVAPDEQPTGHTGACRIEDAGFEIRDAILLAEEAGAMHYVPKPSRSEREAGCQGLEGRAGHEAVERKEGTAGLNNPRAGAGRTASHVKNFHPTVKPIGIMARLLESVPQGTVCDPFMGSGTTGCAAAQTGHDFIGIEMGEEYIEIADARVRHWRTAFAGHGPRAQVVSDFDGEDDITIKAKPEGELFDLFWGDE
jgi:hypothetical protein